MKPSFAFSALNVLSNLVLDFLLFAFVASTKNEVWFITMITTDSRFDAPWTKQFETRKPFLLMPEMAHQQPSMLVQQPKDEVALALVDNARHMHVAMAFSPAFEGVRCLLFTDVA